MASVIFIRGSEALTFDIVADLARGEPVPLVAIWPGLGGTGFEQGIDAALNWDGDKAYLFRGSEYVRIRLASGEVDVGPTPIAREWNGLAEAGFDSDIDAAMNRGFGSVYFLKGKDAIAYSVDNNAVEGRAFPISDWKLEPPFDADIDAAVNYGNGKGYFFKGDEYVRWEIASKAQDSGYPLKTAEKWRGMSEFAHGMDAALCLRGPMARYDGGVILPETSAVSNAAEIDSFFKNHAGSAFIDWFNETVAGRDHWTRDGVKVTTANDTQSRAGFEQFWNLIPEIFGSPAIGIQQFVALQSIAINEIGGTMQPISEKMGFGGGPKGLAYAFEAISGLKSSYNRKPNKLASECFASEPFISAHGQRAFGSDIAGTTDPVWAGDHYPADRYPIDPSAAGIIAEADFYKFRGRGIIQTTWRANYLPLIEYIKTYEGSNPVVSSFRGAWADYAADEAAHRSSNEDWDRLFTESDLLIPVAGIRAHSRSTGYLDISANLETRAGMGRGSYYLMGRSISGSPSYGALFARRCLQIETALEGLLVPDTPRRIRSPFPGAATVRRVVRRRTRPQRPPTRPESPSQEQLPLGFPFERPLSDEAMEVVILRPTDLVVLRIGLTGFERDGSSIRPAGAGPHLVTVTFPPQCMAEEAFHLDESNKPPGSRPIQTLLSGPSRLVVSLDATRPPIELTPEGVLAALVGADLQIPKPDETAPSESTIKIRIPQPSKTGIDPQVLRQRLVALRPPIRLQGRESEEARTEQESIRLVDAGALTAGQLVRATRSLSAVRNQALFSEVLNELLAERHLPPIAEPEAHWTAIEMPHRLFITPSPGLGWSHPIEPAQIGGRVELWTSELGRRLANGAVDTDLSTEKTFRAFWSRDSGFKRRGARPKITIGGERPQIPVPQRNDFTTSMEPRHRDEIVHLSSSPNLKRSGASVAPRAIGAKRLALSSLGAWLDSRGSWPDPLPDGFGVLLWRHRAAMGRDIEVKIVEAGYLAPFGHKAARLQITDRRFHPDVDGNPAYLRQQVFVIVREPTRAVGGTGIAYSGSDSAKVGERFDLQIPLRQVCIRTLITPPLQEPSEDLLFWPEVSDGPFKFEATAFDLDGRQFDFRLPMLFVGKAFIENPEGDQLYNEARLAKVAKAYDGGVSSGLGSTNQNLERRRLDVGGVVLSYAEGGSEADDTGLLTSSITLGLGIPAGTEAVSTAPTPPFAPVLNSSVVDIPSLKQLAPEASRMEVTYYSPYLKGGFSTDGAGAGEVFVQTSSKIPLSFDDKAKNSGGFLTPNFEIEAISRKVGPVGGDLEGLRKGGPDFAKIFSEALSARLFGAVPLGAIIAPADDVGSSLPRFTSATMDPAQNFLATAERMTEEAKAAGIELGKTAAATEALMADFRRVVNGDEPENGLGQRLESLGTQLAGVADAHAAASEPSRRRIGRYAKELQAAVANERLLPLLDGLAEGAQLSGTPQVGLEWRPKLQAASVFVPRQDASLVLAVDRRPATTSDGEPLSGVSCQLRSFNLELGPVVLSFDQVSFSIEPGRKPATDVRLAGITLRDELSFVQTLIEVLPMDGFGDSADLEVDSTGITASFATSVPTVAVGVMSIEDISLSARCRLPLVGQTPLSMRFDFAKPERPAALTVSMFGGAAYFGFELCPVEEDPLVAVRGALEFGASVSLDFGVASGSVLVRAGIYFEINKGSVELTGYFRIRGEVDVLGLISASLELRLELSYQDPGKVKGRAELEIEVEIAWFSTSVTVTCERVFSGGNADPTFIEAMTDANDPDYDPWSEYCGAFA